MLFENFHLGQNGFMFQVVKHQQVICLVGVNKDGTSTFFFNKTVHAYPKGERKRRRITLSDPTDGSVRWRKTGKTKPVMINGVQKGCKKFMVLYKSAKKGLKPNKYKWVMHQYHLGREEETGEYVVSKIMYQQQQVSQFLSMQVSNVHVISRTINGLCFLVKPGTGGEHSRSFIVPCREEP